MSDSHRTRLATDRYEARANTRRRMRTLDERDGRSAKAARQATRSKMRETVKAHR